MIHPLSTPICMTQTGAVAENNCYYSYFSHILLLSHPHECRQSNSVMIVVLKKQISKMKTAKRCIQI